MSKVKDAITVVPHMHKVLLENDRVCVIEYWGKPGDKAGMHSHQDRVIYHLEGKVKARSRTHNGQVREFEIKLGDVMWSPASTHAFKFIEGDDVVIST